MSGHDLAGLSVASSVLIALAPHGRERQLRTGECLIDEMASAPALYVVMAGELRSSVGGVEHARHGAGTMVGEVAWYEHGRAWATIDAACDSTLVELDDGALEVLRTTEPGARRAVVHSLCVRELARQQHRLAGRANPTASELAMVARSAVEAVAFDRAEQLLDIALAVAITDAQREEIQFVWSVMAGRTRDAERALGWVERGVACARDRTLPTTTSMSMLEHRARLLAQLGRHAEAEAALRSAIAMKETLHPPSVGPAMVDLARLICQRGDPVAAEATLLAALELVRRENPGGEADALYHHALIRIELDDREGAVRLFDQAAQLDNDHVRAKIQLQRGYLAQHEHRLDDAEAHFGADPDELPARRGFLAFERGHLDACIEHTTAAIAAYRREARTVSAWFVLTDRGDALREAGRFDEAARDLEEALGATEHRQQRFHVRLSLARLAEARGDRDEALAHYTDAEIDAPSTLTGKRSLVWLWLAEVGLYAERGDHGTAAALLARARTLEARIQAVRGPATSALIELAAARLAGNPSNKQAALAGAESLLDRCAEVRRVYRRVAG